MCDICGIRPKTSKSKCIVDAISPGTKCKVTTSMTLNVCTFCKDKENDHLIVTLQASIPRDDYTRVHDLITRDDSRQYWESRQELKY